MSALSDSVPLTSGNSETNADIIDRPIYSHLKSTPISILKGRNPLRKAQSVQLTNSSPSTMSSPTSSYNWPPSILRANGSTPERSAPERSVSSQYLEATKSPNAAAKSSTRPKSYTLVANPLAVSKKGISDQPLKRELSSLSEPTIHDNEIEANAAIAESRSHDNANDADLTAVIESYPSELLITSRIFEEGREIASTAETTMESKEIIESNHANESESQEMPSSVQANDILPVARDLHVTDSLSSFETRESGEDTPPVATDEIRRTFDGENTHEYSSSHEEMLDRHDDTMVDDNLHETETLLDDKAMSTDNPNDHSESDEMIEDISLRKDKDQETFNTRIRWFAIICYIVMILYEILHSNPSRYMRSYEQPKFEQYKPMIFTPTNNSSIVTQIEQFHEKEELLRPVISSKEEPLRSQKALSNGLKLLLDNFNLRKIISKMREILRRICRLNIQKLLDLSKSFNKKSLNAS